MIITAPASLKTGDIGIVIRDYKTIESCEAVSKYIHSLRGTSYNESNRNAQGIWRSNRCSKLKKETFIVALRVPDASEFDNYREHIEELDRNCL